jgi:hypothetical protein
MGYTIPAIQTAVVIQSTHNQRYSYQNKNK